MTMPFGVWEVNEEFNRALEFEEEQDEQNLEEEIEPEDEFVVRLSPAIRPKADDGSKDAFQGVSKLIITTDDVSAAFTDAYLLSEKTEKVGLGSGPYCSHKDGNTVHQNSLWDKTCFFYKFDDKSDILICQIKQTIETKHMFDWEEKVFAAVKPKQVIILTSISKSKLQMESQRDDGLDFLCRLSSDTVKMKSSIPELERPNLIRDLPSQVLTHCQVNEIAAVLYILVTESFLFDVMAVKAFAPILKEESFQDIKKASESSITTSLKKLCSLKIPDKGVYI